MPLSGCTHAEHTHTRTHTQRERERERERMSRRQSLSGRPSGTDGSDFSYRMVVDSRYTKVAQGKGRLGRLLLAQTAIQAIGILWTLLLALQYKSPKQLAISSLFAGFTSVAIGESGRRRNHVSLLKIYIFIASVAAVLCIVQIIRSDFLLEARNTGFSVASSNYPEAIATGCLLLSILLHMYSVTSTCTLISNMSVKRAS